MRIRVFIAGPYTVGDVAINVKNAINAGDSIMKMGYIPIIPHLTHFWHMLHPHEYEEWLEYSTELVKMCDIVVVLPGSSLGAARESKLALDLGIPVYDYYPFLQEHKFLVKQLIMRRPDYIGKAPNS